MRRRTFEDEDDDLDHEDRPGQRRRPRKRRSNRPLVIVLVLGLGFLFFVGVGSLADWWFAVRPGQQLERNKERLIGRWTAVVEYKRRLDVSYEFHKDGVVVFSMSRQDGASVTNTGRWRTLRATSDTIVIHMDFTLPNEEIVQDMDIKFLGDDRFTYNSPHGYVVDAKRVR
jgi:hypothetical protein